MQAPLPIRVLAALGGLAGGITALIALAEPARQQPLITIALAALLLCGAVAYLAIRRQHLEYAVPIILLATITGAFAIQGWIAPPSVSNPPAATTNTPQTPRQQLAELRYDWTPSAFGRAIEVRDRIAFDLFIETGMTPNSSALWMTAKEGTPDWIRAGLLANPSVSRDGCDPKALIDVRDDSGASFLVEFCGRPIFVSLLQEELDELETRAAAAPLEREAVANFVAECVAEFEKRLAGTAPDRINPFDFGRDALELSESKYHDLVKLNPDPDRNTYMTYAGKKLSIDMAGISSSSRRAEAYIEAGCKSGVGEVVPPTEWTVARARERLARWKKV